MGHLCTLRWVGGNIFTSWRKVTRTSVLPPADAAPVRPAAPVKANGLPQIPPGSTVTGTYRTLSFNNVYNPAEGYVPADFGTGNARTNSAEDVPIKDIWVEFGATISGLGCASAYYTDISTSGTITQTVTVTSETNLPCFPSAATVTLSSAAFRGCTLTYRGDSTFTQSMSGSISLEGGVTLQLPQSPDINFATAAYSASWQLACPGWVSLPA